ncbi:hypothetical protein [Microvirga rosea]|uniref:hypothetical protein n=1 Tax=Microvirga rosea TaxID=2715425 RepID=UPI001D0B59DB|nr:hypothetical protein [Microvirga rosea]MCB8821908.1 hypothetical protein [Microvirga rosea]
MRLVAAAARAGDLPELRDFEAELFDVLLDAVFAAPRAEVFFAAERAEVFEPPRAALERDALERAEVVLLDAGLLAVLREVDFAADLAGAFRAVERDVEDFAAVFLAPDREAVLRLVVLDADFLAELREVVFAADFVDFAADLVPDLVPDLVADLAPDFVPALEAVLREAVFEPLLRDEVPADFAADLRAVEVPLFLAPDVPLFLLEELRRALLFFDLVLVAPESPVNSIVSGLDLSSVGIAASFKGLRVQPSRFEGNVVIPRGFRLTESVESKTSTFSVDTFREVLLSSLRTERETTAAILAASLIPT